MKALPLIALLALTACDPLTVTGGEVPVSSMTAPQTAPYLANGVMVGTVNAEHLRYGALEQRDLALKNLEIPLAEALKQAGLLAKNLSKAPYRLDADVLEIGNAVCMFGECTITVTAAYRLMSADIKEPIWQRRIKTKHIYAHGTFSRMDDTTHRAIIGSALAASFDEVVAALTDVPAPKKAEKSKAVSPKKTH